MSAQEIIAELEKMDIGERQQVADGLQRLAEAPADEPKRDVWDVLLEYAGTVDGLPTDMSVNHDHYLYGSPKQQS